MNKVEPQTAPPRTLADVLKQLNLCHRQCQAIAARNQRQFDCF